MDERFVVVGLGNPGPDYANTRHNMGYLVVEHLAAQYNATFTRHRSGATVADIRVGADRRPVTLAKTGTFMNVSGRVVAAVLAFYHLSPSQLIVVHDDIDLPFDQVRIKVGGGHGGHNGLRDIITVLGTPDFTRIRVGVGRPPGKTDTADHVLARFTGAQRDALPNLIVDAADATTTSISEGVAAAQLIFHTRTT